MQKSQILKGPFAVIDNKAGALLKPVKNGNDLYFNAKTEAELAQVSAFYWVNFTHEFARPYLPASPTILVNNPVRVNINQTCNAFWSGGDHSLNFFKAGPNAAGISTATLWGCLSRSSARYSIRGISALLSDSGKTHR